nr:Chain P, Nuclear receptor coactivator 2 [Homo sapiens]
ENALLRYLLDKDDT